MNVTDRERVERACAELTDTGQPITFTAVANRASIGCATLYRRPELRAGLETVAAKVRRHDEQLRRLTAPATRRRGARRPPLHATTPTQPTTALAG